MTRPWPVFETLAGVVDDLAADEAGDQAEYDPGEKGHVMSPVRREAFVLGVSRARRRRLQPRAPRRFWLNVRLPVGGVLCLDLGDLGLGFGLNLFVSMDHPECLLEQRAHGRRTEPDGPCPSSHLVLTCKDTDRDARFEQSYWPIKRGKLLKFRRFTFRYFDPVNLGFLTQFS